MGEFCRILSRLRHEAGFSTGYAFYHRRGGRRAFPFTFAYYRRIERGENRPRLEWIGRLLDLLPIPETDERRRELIVGFLRDLFVSEANFQTLVEPLLRPPAKLERPANGRAPVRPGLLTSAQSAAVLANEAAFWTFECLANGRKAWTTANLAEKSGFSEERIHAALKALIAHGMAEKPSGGRSRASAAKSYYIFRRPSGSREKDIVARYIDDMVSSRGALVQESRIVLRAEEDAARRVFAALSRALETAAADAAAGREGAALVAFQVRARKVFDF